jgi:hypothetical protein
MFAKFRGPTNDKPNKFNDEQKRLITRNWLSVKARLDVLSTV